MKYLHFSFSYFYRRISDNFLFHWILFLGLFPEEENQKCASKRWDSRSYRVWWTSANVNYFALFFTDENGNKLAPLFVISSKSTTVFDMLTSSHTFSKMADFNQNAFGCAKKHIENGWTWSICRLIMWQSFLEKRTFLWRKKEANRIRALKMVFPLFFGAGS